MLLFVRFTDSSMIHVRAYMEISPERLIVVYGASSTSSSFLPLAGSRHVFLASSHFHSLTPFVFFYRDTQLHVFL